MDIKELYEQKTPQIENKVAGYVNNHDFEDVSKLEKKKANMILPLFVDGDINNTELKTFYFTKTQIALIDILAAKNFKKQSEYLRNIVTDGLMKDILDSRFTDEEIYEIGEILAKAVKTDLLEKESFYKSKKKNKRHFSNK